MTKLRSWILLSLALPTMAIASSASPLSHQVPQYRGEVNAIQTDVLVLDDQGLPMVGLTLDDFEVYEDGVRQRLSSVEMIGSRSDEATVEVTPRRFVFVINRLGATPVSLVKARNALEGFVTTFLTDDDKVMVVDIGYTVRVLQPFCGSKDATIRDIRNLPLLRVDYPHHSHYGERYVFEALESLGEALGDVPGRKIVILLSNELHSRYGEDIDDTIDALNESNSTVYSIDLELVYQRVRRRLFQRHTRYAIEGLFPLANETGGRYFYNQTRFERPVRRIGEENSSYYLLTFTSSNRALDGEYRKLQVKVKRPEMKVVARRGYVAPRVDEAGLAGG